MIRMSIKIIPSEESRAGAQQWLEKFMRGAL